MYLGKHYKKWTQDAFLSRYIKTGIFLLDKVNLIQSYYYFLLSIPVFRYVFWCRKTPACIQCPRKPRALLSAVSCSMTFPLLQPNLCLPGLLLPLNLLNCVSLAVADELGSFRRALFVWSAVFIAVVQLTFSLAYVASLQCSLWSTIWC